ncbi:ATP-dependent RNA helicase DOB1 [Schizosaccharomyces japonicus yFS275]|uniref:ATP-dependent RNA helicase DOB1 n=1 Tax=Schizosaccharomyces japonicus (strain yFS275 / FY16936) TaxID=402676 RepID=B6K2B4_SCHJY|nr:ATP-dependent RNA helicase DOB1 [Schizosaccharomyces japonicus yFS275]EEB07295.1 ATP-dependent RNA helicase DOB1 [Schizosaccharomyces japonicus yFS275]
MDKQEPLNEYKDKNLPTDSSKMIIVEKNDTENGTEKHKPSGLKPLQGTIKIAGQIVELAAQPDKQVLHEVSLPADYDYKPIEEHVGSTSPARSYEFSLDPFQAASIACVERKESIIVSAHTSAGKTVVAEYAIAQALKNGERVVYTSPIKSLSNQKYREFLAEFGDVGLMTGDVTLNPNAGCLVMTTEILRSMLYKSSELTREVSWVIFDEVHYMRDKDRGVVWEETIILLPDAVRYIFLSATLPNAKEFADWICKIHNQPCHVVYTSYRPTPLQHFLFPRGANGIYMIVDEHGKLMEGNFQKAMSILNEQDETSSRKKQKQNKSVPELFRLVKMITANDYDPLIIFCFSKKECEAGAVSISSLEVIDDKKKELVDQVFNSAMNQLSETDRCIPQITNMLPLLRRGIGIHHSGMLPILREVVEILFQEGLITILFATETFSIGLNMPARTVLFTEMQKFSGESFRWINSSEYTQMSGRAGRRGLDERGLSIVMANKNFDLATAKAIFTGPPAALNSAFRISYNMILNLLRIEGITPDYILKHSFYQHQNEAKLPELNNECSRMKLDMESIVIPHEQDVQEFYDLKLQLKTYEDSIRKIMAHPEFCLPFLQPGRLIQVRLKDQVFPWGILVNFHKAENASLHLQIRKSNPSDFYVLDVLLPVDKNTFKTNKIASSLMPGLPENATYEVVAVSLSSMHSISSLRVSLPSSLITPEQKKTTYHIVQEISKRFPDGVPCLDPIEHMRIDSDSLRSVIHKIQILEPKVLNSPYYTDEEFQEHYDEYCRKLQLRDQWKALKATISKTESVITLSELKSRRRVLRRLGYINEDGVIDIKGRVACEISTGDELVLTEMIFSGLLNQLPIDQFAALLSCLVFQESSSTSATNVDSRLSKPYQELLKLAEWIATVSRESKLEITEEEYVSHFKPDLMSAVIEWMNGASFTEICGMVHIYEGSIVRSFRRLEELLRQLQSAAQVLGNSELASLSERAADTMRRDVIFSASLYL